MRTPKSEPDIFPRVDPGRFAPAVEPFAMALSHNK